MHYSNRESSPPRPRRRAFLAMARALVAATWVAGPAECHRRSGQSRLSSQLRKTRRVAAPRVSPTVRHHSSSESAARTTTFLTSCGTVVAGKIIGTHPVVVTRVNSEEDAKSCYIVFFRTPEKKHALADVEGLAQPGLLLIGEERFFSGQGGMINLSGNTEASTLKSTLTR